MRALSHSSEIIMRLSFPYPSESRLPRNEMCVMDFTLVLDRKSFPASKRKLVGLFELQPCLFDERIDWREVKFPWTILMFS
jgi:hypothetical protein